MLLIAIFIIGTIGVIYFGNMHLLNSNFNDSSFTSQNSFPGFVGGAIGCGLIASSALLGLIYYEVAIMKSKSNQKRIE